MGDTRARIQEAYDTWAATYDTNENPTRDLNAEVLRKQLGDALAGAEVLELGCGTGLNTAWLAARARRVVAVDFSAEMLDRARSRVDADHVRFLQADVTAPWPVADEGFDGLVTTLVLEHVADLGAFFRSAHRVLRPGGLCYISELHPYKQLRGSQAKYTDADTGEEQRVPAFQHTVAEFVNAGLSAGFTLQHMGEWPDAVGEAGPRLLTLRFER